LKYYGNDYYKQYIDSRYDLTSILARLVKTDNKLELAAEPESNIICFRFKPDGFDDIELNPINARIRDRIIKEGSFYIVQAELEGKIWLRLTIINPVTSEDDLKDLLKRVLTLGQEEAGVI
jgi:L-2,4-diaminobutyrate decarboxylase